MSRFSTGAEAIRASAAAAKGGGKFAPEMFWKADDEKVIQFITPLNQIPTVPTYNLRVGTTDQGKPIMRTFIDPTGVVENAYNPIPEKWPYVKPKNKQMALAVELEPVIEKVDGRKKRTGFVVATRTFTRKSGENAGEEVTVPNVAVIINTHLFFNYLTSWEEDKGDIRDWPFKVTRVGADRNTQYHFIAYERDEKVELDDEVLNAVSLDDYEALLMSPERYHDNLDGLDEDFVVDRFAAARASSDAKTKPTNKASTKSRKVVEEDVDEGDAVEDDGDDDTASRKKFDELKTKFG